MIHEFQGNRGGVATVYIACVAVVATALLLNGHQLDFSHGLFELRTIAPLAENTERTKN
jgi:hypothetical protein